MQKARILELNAVVSLARLWIRNGQGQRVYDRMHPLNDWFTQGNETPDLQSAKTLLATLD